MSRNPQYDFPKMRGGGQRPFGTFPKIHQFWRRHPSLRNKEGFKCFYITRNTLNMIWGISYIPHRFDRSPTSCGILYSRNHNFSYLRFWRNSFGDKRERIVRNLYISKALEALNAVEKVGRCQICAECVKSLKSYLNYFLLRNKLFLI